MKIRKRYIVLLLLFALFSGIFINTKLNQTKVSSLSNHQVTEIHLEHYGEEIVIDSSDPNFDEIVHLMSKTRVSFRFFGFMGYGTPITATFYSEQQELVSVSSGLLYTCIDGGKFFTSISGRRTAERLGTILGSYYGYDQ